ncbi:MAG: hypothetical protein ACSLFK_02415 [Gemmatimonadaceae bacterium]
MFAVLTAVILAQSSITIGAGGKPGDSAAAARRESAEVRRQVIDSVRRRVRDDSSEIRKRRARQIPLTPALMASAFKDPRAGSLLSMARTSRLEQDSALTGYDAQTYERMSVGLGFKKIARERLLMRMERAARVVWSKNNPVYVEILGKREAFPALTGILDREDSEVDTGNDGVPIPYFPGRETLWVGSGIAKADIDASEIVHPLARGAEAYYTYASGDSVSFQLPGGRRIEIRELVVRPRAPKWNVALGSLWFDVSSARLVRAVFRLAEPMDIWAIADEEAERENDPDDAPPGWVKGLISPLKAQINAVTVEYGLHEGRFWMPRLQALDGSAQAGMFRVPFKMEQSFKYSSVNGAVPIDIPAVAVMDTAQDSVSRAYRRQRARAACTDSGTAQRITRRLEGTLSVLIRTPCDTVALANSSALPKSIYDESDELLSSEERESLIEEALTLGAQPGWTPQKPVFTYGLSQTRYNKIEALSTGLAVSQTLGQGYTARASVRLGIGDWQPNGEIGMWRSNGRSAIALNAYRRLSAADDFENPLTFSSSLSALLFGRDDGFYYRRIGVEFAGTPDDSVTTSWKLFAEHHTDAERNTTFSIAKALGGDGFDENIDADGGYYVGIAAERHGSRGLDPNGFRMFGGVRAEAATGEMSYARGMFDVTLSNGITSRIDGALTLAAGMSGGDLPVQRLWYLGGSQSVRGQAGGAARGDAFWMGRVEFGSSVAGARPVVFYDLGWAGDRSDFSDPGRPISGAGVGASFLDGLVRFDLARGIYPEKKIRANLYLEARF